MNRLVRGSVLIAAAVGVWACGGDPFAEDLETVTEISANPQVVSVSNTDSQAVIVEALNALGQQNAAEFDHSNVTAGLIVTRDTTFLPVIEGEGLKTQARYFVKGSDATTFTAGSFDVTAGGQTVTVDVSVVPSTIAGSVPASFSNATPALGDTISLTLPANVRITDSSSVTFADASVGAAIVGASADSNTIFVLVGAGVTDQSAIVNDVAISYLPGQLLDLQTSAIVTTPGIDSLPAVFSSSTPSGGAQVTLTAASPAFGFVFDSTVSISFGAGESWIDSVSADGSTVYFVPPPGATGNPLVDGAALDFLPSVPLLLPATTGITVGTVAGTDDPSTAPPIALPGSGASIAIYDGGTLAGISFPEFGGFPTKFYSISVGASSTFDVSARWLNEDDLGLYFWDAADCTASGVDCLNSTPVSVVDGLGGGPEPDGQPEEGTITLAAGNYIMGVVTFGSAAGPPVLRVQFDVQ